MATVDIKVRSTRFYGRPEHAGPNWESERDRTLETMRAYESRRRTPTSREIEDAKSMLMTGGKQNVTYALYMVILEAADIDPTPFNQNYRDE